MANDTAVRLSFLEWLNNEELARQRAVVKARQYHDGEQSTFLNERLKEFLYLGKEHGDPDFHLNVCRSVVSAVTERMIVNSFDSADKALAAWAWQVWQDNRMDSAQDEVHEGAIRDGEYFVLVDWDTQKRRVRFTSHQRFTDGTVGGDGFGCKMFYPDDNPSLPALYACKRWTEVMDQGRARQRITLYYPERVEKYASAGAVWEPVQDVGDSGWPLAWVDSAGQPLGLPVIHFYNPGLRCEAWDAIPMQNAINKTLIDLLASADLTAFRIFVAFGWIPTSDGKSPADDGSNLLALAPGQVLGTTRSKTEAGFEAIEPADLSPLLDLLQQLVLYLASVSAIPGSRFQIIRQVMAEGTLKQQIEPLLAKIRRRQVLLGNAWENCFYIARKLANTFGGESLSEDAQLSTQWADLETRNEKEHLETLKLKKELGVTQEQIWSEMGYDQEHIAQMQQAIAEATPPPATPDEQAAMRATAMQHQTAALMLDGLSSR